jgi:hypothetical protein
MRSKKSPAQGAVHRLTHLRSAIRTFAKEAFKMELRVPSMVSAEFSAAYRPTAHLRW